MKCNADWASEIITAVTINEDHQLKYLLISRHEEEEEEDTVTDTSTRGSGRGSVQVLFTPALQHSLLG